MKVLYGLQNLPPLPKVVLTIGSFDGIHLGHRKILDQLMVKAKSIEGTSVVITFDPHPRRVLQPNQPFHLLNTLQEKIDILASLHIDVLVVVPFTPAFASMSAVSYIQDFLVKHFHPHTIIIGYDHHFGKNRSGNIHMLLKEQSHYGYKIEEIPAQEIDHIAISSTKIRNYLQQGEVDLANTVLCKHYSLYGKVVKGFQRGRQLGYPTANIQVEDEFKLIPARGVYAVKVVILNQEYTGMLNIGIRPTITDENVQSVEVHILDFSDDIYGENITIKFMEKIREEIKMPSLEALQKQLVEDEIKVRAIFSQL